MRQRIQTLDEFIFESRKKRDNHFSRVKKYWKKEAPDVKIGIKKRANKYQTAKFGGINFEIKVGEYKFEFTAYDGSTDTENQLLRTIGNIIDDGRHRTENPDFK